VFSNFVITKSKKQNKEQKKKTKNKEQKQKTKNTLTIQKNKKDEQHGPNQKIQG
jgi:hypothetical protein